MSCAKNSYYTETEAQEALIRSHIRFYTSATNYYRCDDCGEFHLTSGATPHPLLADPEVQKRIRDEQREQEWMERLRKR